MKYEMLEKLQLNILRKPRNGQSFLKLKSLLGSHLFVMNKAMTEDFIEDRDVNEIFMYKQNITDIISEYPNSFSLYFFPDNFEKISYIDVKMMKNVLKRFKEFFHYLQEHRLLPLKVGGFKERKNWEYIMSLMEREIYDKELELKDKNLVRWI